MRRPVACLLLALVVFCGSLLIVPAPRAFASGGLVAWSEYYRMYNSNEASTSTNNTNARTRIATNHFSLMPALGGKVPHMDDGTIYYYVESTTLNSQNQNLRDFFTPTLWSKASELWVGNVTLIEASSPSNAHVVFKYNPAENSSTVASTQAYPAMDNDGVIQRNGAAYINIFPQFFDTTYDNLRAHVVAHELGHIMGLGDVYEPLDYSMFPALSDWPETPSSLMGGGKWSVPQAGYPDLNALNIVRHNHWQQDALMQWSYLDSPGVPHTGWLTDGEKKYYFNSAGIRMDGLQIIGGHEYYFDPSDGRMRTGLIYIGPLTLYFNAQTGRRELPLTRLGGSTRYDTMKTIATYSRSLATTAIIVSGEEAAWPDALSASGLAGIYNAPILTTASGHLPSQTIQALITLNVSRVIIIGGPAMISDTVKNQIVSIVGPYVARIYGADRYETAEKIYSAAPTGSWLHPTGGYKSPNYSSSHTWKNGTRKKAAILVTGTSFPDGLSASALAAYAHFPIFLVRADGTLTATTQKLLGKGNFDARPCS